MLNTFCNNKRVKNVKQVQIGCASHVGSERPRQGAETYTVVSPICPLYTLIFKAKHGIVFETQAKTFHNNATFGVAAAKKQFIENGSSPEMLISRKIMK